MSYWIYSILLMIANLTVLPQLPTNLMNTLQEENVEIRLGEDFVIQKGETAIYNHEIRLTLMDIKDSRCPKGMNCFRAGELLVVLFVEQEASNQSITLMNPTWEKGGKSQTIIFEKYQLVLKGDQGNPDSYKSKVKPEDMQVIFLLEEI